MENVTPEQLGLVVEMWNTTIEIWMMAMFEALAERLGHIASAMRAIG